ncbi:MAG: NAD(P)/FAD-dependent oxidoreductase [Evtepia sp.]
MNRANQSFDVLIVGGGAVGCAIARELARYRLSIALVEKEADVAAGTSGRNSAVVHAGFNNRPGSLMAKLCVAGNQGFPALCQELDVPFRKTGKILVAFDETDLATLRRLKAQGEANGCRGLELLDRAQLQAKLPQVGGIGGFFSPETGICDPFLYTVALAENAVANGVAFFLNHPVTAIAPAAGGYQVTAGDAVFSAQVVVNAAGLYSAQVAAWRDQGTTSTLPGSTHPTRSPRGSSLPAYPAPRAGEGGWGSTSPPPFTGTSSWAPAPNTSTPWRTLPPPSRCWTGCFRRPSSSSPA